MPEDISISLVGPDQRLALGAANRAVAALAAIPGTAQPFVDAATAQAKAAAASAAAAAGAVAGATTTLSATLSITTTALIGRQSDPAAGSGAQGATYILSTPAAPGASAVTGLKLNVVAAGTVYIGRYTLAGGTMTKVASYSFNAAATGLQTFTASDFGTVPLNPGEYLAIYAPGIMSYNAGTDANASFYTLSGNMPASSASGSVQTASHLEVQFAYADQQQVVTGPAFAALQALVATFNAQVSASAVATALLYQTARTTAGSNVALTDGSAMPQQPAFFLDPVQQACTFDSFDYFDKTAATLQVGNYRTINGVLTLVAAATFTTSGTGAVQRYVLPAPLPVQAGDIMAVVGSIAGAFSFTSTAIGGLGVFLGTVGQATLPATQTITSGNTFKSYLFMVRFNLSYQTQTVTAAALSQAAGGSPIIPLAAADRPTLLGNAGWQHILVYGQSLSTGINAQPAISTAQPYANLTFGSGVRSGKPGNSAGAVNTSPGTTTTKPLIEENASSSAPAADGGTNNGETICTGAATAANDYAAIESDIAPGNLLFFASAAGHTGAGITSLYKGSAWYNQLLDHVTEAKARATAAGKSYACQAVPYMQGEADAMASGTASAYKANLETLVANINADIPAITGQATPVHLLIYQIAGSNAGATQATVNQVKQAQFDAINETPHLHFAGPIYHLQSANDQIHITNVSQLRFARTVGRAVKQLLVDGRVPDCIWPISATARGTALRIKFRVPRFPLVLDAAALGAITNMGFRVTDDTGDLALSGIQVSPTHPDEVMITLNRALSTNPVVRHALDYVAPSNTFTLSGSGCLRDSTPGTSIIQGVSFPEWHVAPAFQIPVIALQVQA